MSRATPVWCLALAAFVLMQGLVFPCGMGDTDGGAGPPEEASRAKGPSLLAYLDSGHNDLVTYSDVPSTVYILLLYDGGYPDVKDEVNVTVTDESSWGAGFEIKLHETDIASNNYTSALFLRPGSTPSKNELGVYQGSIVNISFTMDGAASYRFPVGKFYISPFLGDTYVQEDSLVSIVFRSRPYTVSDWDFVSEGDWIEWDDVTHTLSGTPNNTDIGVWTVSIKATDVAGNYNLLNFKIIVVNTAPTIISHAPESIVEDELYCTDLESDDEDFPTAKWSMTSKSGWLTIDPRKGILNGTPGDKDVGSNEFNVSIFDGHNRTSNLKLFIKVINKNDPPVLTGVPANSTLEINMNFVFDVNATDDDINDRLQYGVSSFPPADMFIDKDTGELNWTPRTIGLHLLTLTATDGINLVTKVVRMEVVRNDIPPSVKVLTPANGYYGTSLRPTLSWEAHDADSPDLVSMVYLSEDVNLIIGRSPDAEVANRSNIRSLTVASELEADTTYYWTVWVYDGVYFSVADGNISQFRTRPKPKNNPPVLLPVETVKVKVGEPVEMKISSLDVDPWDAMNITYTLQSAPRNTVLNRTTGDLTWFPTSRSVGNNSVTVLVSDGKGSSTRTYYIVVSGERKPGALEQNIWLMPVVAVAVFIVLLSVVIIVSLRPKKEKRPAEPLRQPIAPTFTSDDLAQIMNVAPAPQVPDYYQSVPPPNYDAPVDYSAYQPQEYSQEQYGQADQGAGPDAAQYDAASYAPQTESSEYAADTSGAEQSSMEGVGEQTAPPAMVPEETATDQPLPTDTEQSSMQSEYQGTEPVQSEFNAEEQDILAQIIQEEEAKAPAEAPKEDIPVAKATVIKAPVEQTEEAGPKDQTVRSKPPAFEGSLEPAGKQDFTEKQIMKALTSLPFGLPNDLAGKEIDDLVNEITGGEFFNTPEGLLVVKLGKKYYQADLEDPGNFLRRYKG